MKARMLALTGVALVVLAGPAAASDAQGWYLNLAGGFDHMGNIEVPQSPLVDVNGHKIDKINTGNSGVIEGGVGFRFPDRIRFEAEVGYTSHNVDATDATTQTIDGLLPIAALPQAAQDPLTLSVTPSFLPRLQRL